MYTRGRSMLPLGLGLIAVCIQVQTASTYFLKNQSQYPCVFDIPNLEVYLQISGTMTSPALVRELTTSGLNWRHNMRLKHAWRNVPQRIEMTVYAQALVGRETHSTSDKEVYHCFYMLWWYRILDALQTGNTHFIREIGSVTLTTCIMIIQFIMCRIKVSSKHVASAAYLHHQQAEKKKPCLV